MSNLENLQKTLIKRSENQCELCCSKDTLQVYAVIKREHLHADNHLLLCVKCRQLLDQRPFVSDSHWECLKNKKDVSLEPLQIISYRVLSKLETMQVDWAEELLDQLYFGIDTIDAADETFL